MTLTPKGPRAATAATAGSASISNIDSQRAKRQRGRPSGLGYDPESGEEVAGPTLERFPGDADPESDVLAVIGTRGYSEDRFYTKSSDERGHSKMLRLWIPQGIDAQVYGATNEIPQYRTVQDFMRDAIVHRLEYLQKRYKLSDQGRRLLELERWKADSERRSVEIQTMTSAVNGVGERLTEAWAAEDYSLFVQEMREAEEQIDWLRDPYKERMITLLKEWKRKAASEIAKVRDKNEE